MPALIHLCAIHRNIQIQFIFVDNIFGISVANGAASCGLILVILYRCILLLFTIYILYYIVIALKCSLPCNAYFYVFPIF